ncbi:MAG: hypothetical protein JO015_11410 [Verrucomicrobia bacterium]|nr:hypothetical protein [Verrucomicrobiota bacterium]
MPFLPNRVPSLLRPAASLALATFLAAAFPGGSQAQGLLQFPQENGRAESKVPSVQRADGILQYLQWLLHGPVQDPTGFRVEVAGTPGFSIVAVQLARTGEGLRIRGAIRRDGFGSGYGHLDIELLDLRGRLLSTYAVSYVPDPVPMTRRGWVGRSDFAARFDRLPAGLAIIRVRFHPKD